MPELPEVETICRQLKKEILNKKITGVVVNDKRLIKGVSTENFKAQIKGKEIKRIFRRGKVLILALAKTLFLVIHLRITGWLILSKKKDPLSRVTFKFSGKRQLHFCDQRVFGELKLLRDWRELAIIKRMGPEPLKLKKKAFINLFAGRRTKVKPLLMDQKFLAGLGNIYAQETLFCAGIHPEKRADKLRDKNLAKVYDCLKAILRTAILKRGSSIDTHRQIDGKKGNYVPLLKVYQRKGRPCVRCKALIRRKEISGRGTYFCPRCQK